MSSCGNYDIAYIIRIHTSIQW